MHWKTYKRLCHEVRLAERAWLDEVGNEAMVHERAISRLAARLGMP
jgi:hypothetical protein